MDREDSNSGELMNPYGLHTMPGARADVHSRLPIRPNDDKYTSLTEVADWLRSHGVSKRKAREFLKLTGCTTVDNIALYLRFQLPPLQYANIDCVNQHMRELLGVGGGDARRIIVDLDILHVINLDTNEEATAHLSATGLLSQHSSIAPVSTGSRAVALPPAQQPLSAVGTPDSPPPATLSKPTPKHTSYHMRAVAEARERPGSGDGWSSSSLSWMGVSEQQDAAEEEGVNGSVHSNAPGSMRGPSTTRTATPPSAHARNARPAPRSESVAAKNPYGPFITGTSRSSAGPFPVSPISASHSPVRPRSLPRHHVSGSSTHYNALPPRSGGSSGPMFPALDSSPSLGGAPVDADVSIDICASHPGTPGSGNKTPSQLLSGYPTLSSPLEPGPYHKANVQLRRQLAHYNAEVTVKTRWDHIFFTAIAVLTYIVYICLRLFYLVSGRTATFSAQDTNVVYSYVVLTAEIMLGGLGFYGHQLFWKQEVSHTPIDSKTLNRISEDAAVNGVRQTVHVMVTTYTEPAETVRECLIRLIVAPEPVYMEKVLYVCDDGHAKSEGPKKRAMVEELRVLGHTNVFYIGDRVKKPGQLNGKSANLNHVVLHKIYPTVRSAEEVPMKDILMVIDCDHMCKPELFNKMAPCMLDEGVGVTLVPQWFHNLIFPDAFDSANADFMFSKMPYCFGAGMCYITGTNVMIRARAAFKVCKFSSANLSALEQGLDKRQIYAEDEISEDIELGTRMHAWGYKSVFICEKLATGEVPLDLRSMWRQRLRWLKGGHLLILSPGSVFFKRQPHMTFYEKSLYWLCPVAHFIQLFFEPVIFTLPMLCLVFQTCPYGMDTKLFWTHVAHVGASFIFSTYHRDLERTRISLSAKASYRVLWFTSVKACINTIMVHTGWKNPGHFKFTPKAGISANEAAVSGALAVSTSMSRSVSPTEKIDAVDASGSGAGTGQSPAPGTKHTAAGATKKQPFTLSKVHDSLSKVTETRRCLMPLDGTLDIWVLLFNMTMSLLAAAVGIKRLYDREALLVWDEGRNGLIWIGVVFALVDATPGLLFLGYAAVHDCAPWLLKVWVPMVTFTVAAAVTLIEARVAYGFTTGK